MKRSFVLAAMALTIGGLFFTGCGGGDDDNSSGPVLPASNVAGTWKGTYTLRSSSVAATASLTQNGNDVSGTSTWVQKGSGRIVICDVSGRVVANDVNLTFDYRISGWASDVVAGKIIGNSMNLSGSDGTSAVRWKLNRTSLAAALPIEGDDAEQVSDLTKLQAVSE
jgi:hypothetical protein